ncbi:MAG: hypothetical protein LAQ30_04155 [Acidobacteriia bacterium]|nr:hypothetical protein [Terriglobia bacterium]
MSSKALREHDPAELMPLFERYAEKQFDAEAKELLACFPDPEAYSFQLILLPIKVAMRICPSTGIVPENVMATDCPIHGGKDPNFSVEPATGRWFCHSVCGRGGDIIDLEMALISPGTAISPRRGATCTRRCRPSGTPSSGPPNAQSGGAKPAPPAADRAHGG